MRYALISIPCFLGLLLTSCTTYEATKKSVSVARAWKRPTQTLSRPDRPKPSITSRKPEDLTGYILLALEQNPGIRASIEQVEGRLERILQVSSLDDPMLRLITRPEPIQTAAGDIVFTLAVSQKFPLPAKLKIKGEVAAAQVRESIEQLNALRLRVIADVERVYYRIYVTDRSLEITDQNIVLLRELENVVGTRYEVGKSEQQDLLRIQTELSDLENDKTRYVGQRRSAVAAFNQLLNQPTTTTVPTLPRIEPSKLSARVEELIAIAEENNPELAAFDHRLERDRKEASLADLSYVPDLTLGFEWNHADGRTPFMPPANPQTGVRPPFNDASANGDDNWALSVGINIPIWAHRNEAAKRESRRRLQQTYYEEQAAKNLIAFRINDAWSRAETLQETLRILETTIIPQARQTYEVSLPSFQGGTEDFLTVIDNWRKLLAFELLFHRETAELESVLAELQQEVGVSLVMPKSGMTP